MHQHTICAALRRCRGCHDWQNWLQRHPFQTPVWLWVAGDEEWWPVTLALSAWLGDGFRRQETSSSLVWMRMTACHMLDNSPLSLGNKQRDIYNEIVLQGLWWSHAPRVWTHHLVCMLALLYTSLHPFEAIYLSAQGGIKGKMGGSIRGQHQSRCAGK